MNIPRLPYSISSQPLCIHTPSLRAFCERFDAVNIATNLSGIGDFVNQREPLKMAGDIAIISILGLLAQNTTAADRVFGMTDYAEIIADLELAVNDPNISAIVLDMNSPGGAVRGAPEAAQAVFSASQVKPAVAYVSGVCASAAYYVACSASAIIAQPSATVGSVGTRLEFFDYARSLDAVGVTPHIITPKASDLKASGNAVRTPTDEEMQFLQEHVEAINAEFIAWVKTHRPAIGDESMRGQYFTGNQAITNGLCDFTGTLADAISAAETLANI